jgi:hypothetical protein
VRTAPYQVDDAIAASGNGNGWVCARPVDDQVFVVDANSYQVYNFIDDVIPA